MDEKRKSGGDTLFFSTGCLGPSNPSRNLLRRSVGVGSTLLRQGRFGLINVIILQLVPIRLSVSRLLVSGTFSLSRGEDLVYAVNDIRNADKEEQRGWATFAGDR